MRALRLGSCVARAGSRSRRRCGARGLGAVSTRVCAASRRRSRLAGGAARGASDVVGRRSRPAARSRSLVELGRALAQPLAAARPAPRSRRAKRRRASASAAAVCGQPAQLGLALRRPRRRRTGRGARGCLGARGLAAAASASSRRLRRAASAAASAASAASARLALDVGGDLRRAARSASRRALRRRAPPRWSSCGARDGQALQLGGGLGLGLAQAGSTAAASACAVAAPRRPRSAATTALSAAASASLGRCQLAPRRRCQRRCNSTASARRMWSAELR